MNKNLFPIKVKFLDNGEIRIIKSPEKVPINRPFIMLENKKDKKEKNNE